MTDDNLAALAASGWAITYLFDAAANTGCYVLKRDGGETTLDPGSPTFADDLAAALGPPAPPPPPPLQDRVAAALQDLQAQPTISGADLASVIQALTG